jgi:hypothetical protein
LITNAFHLGDFLIFVVLMSDANGEIGGGEERGVGDKVLSSSAWSITSLYPTCMKLEMCRNSNNQAVSTYNGEIRMTEVGV